MLKLFVLLVSLVWFMFVSFLRTDNTRHRESVTTAHSSPRDLANVKKIIRPLEGIDPMPGNVFGSSPRVAEDVFCCCCG